MRDAVIGHPQRITDFLLGLSLPLQHPGVVLDLVVVGKILACAFGLRDKLPMSLQQELDRSAIHFQTLTPPFFISRSQAYLAASIVWLSLSG